MKELWLGIDCATQSVRGTLIDSSGRIHFRTSEELAPVVRGSDGRLTQDPRSWNLAIEKAIAASVKKAASDGFSVAAISISATSGTFVVTDLQGNPIAPAAMYNDGRANNPLARAAAIIKEVGAGKYLFAHTPEFVVAHLCGRDLNEIATDWSHALKTGVNLQEGDWTSSAREIASDLSLSLPKIVAPGTLLGRTVHDDIPIYAAMTDGCTAQISVGSSALGSAVTTLGTTMVIKIVSAQEVHGPGFYSHLLPGNRWLTGGASNLGGISFSELSGEIAEWDQKAQAHGPASLVLYPLVGVGERFPIANKEMRRIFTASPQGDVDEYRATLEGIAFAEKLAYQTLAAAGAPLTGKLFTVGGGARSHIWNSIRAAVLNRTISIVKESGSDIGAAMIAYAASQGGELAAGLDRFNSSTIEHVAPNSDEVAIYEEKYQEFLNLVSPMQNQEIR
jgi:xylulokinase